MDKRYQSDQEPEIYKLWEKSGAFSPSPEGEPFTIIMPPPNANGQLHIGHALFVTLEDIMIRYQRMRGKAALWLPGADHASIASQVSFEKKLAEKGKTRFDLGREKFFQACYQFTQDNKKMMYQQLKRLGSSCDWTREKFTLDPKISRQVQEAFVRLYQDNLVVRDEKLVNWCPRCMTVLSELELEYHEQTDPLYYIKYGPFTLATVRPETKHGDTAVAVNPKDRRYKKWVGKEIEIEDVLGPARLKVITDKAVDPEFGTGVVKVTPAHDPVDWEIGQKHNLEVRRVINFDGKLNEKAGKYQGLTVAEARKVIVKDLKEKGLIEKVDPSYSHRVAHCERCGAAIEPMVSLQWFILTKPLAKQAIKAVRSKKIKIVPKRFEKIYFQWLENIRDWPVARQLWFGQQLPVWYCGTKTMSELQKTMNRISEKRGCGEIIFSIDKPKKCPQCGNQDLIQDPDVFDTWFSSGQWPYTTLGFQWKPQARDKGQKTNAQNPDFERFYPTDVMETAYDILFFWVARMIMLGLYTTKEIPFHTVYLHGLVRDAKGQKMSKSRGNVINPLPVSDSFGADALRMALIVGTSPGNDSSVSYEKIKGYRNFANKIWNAARFVRGSKQARSQVSSGPIHSDDQKMLTELKKTVTSVTKDMDRYRFSPAGETIYHFFWHFFCDWYIETIKDRVEEAFPYLTTVLTTCLRLLHPFMPFVTESIWQEFHQNNLLPTSLKNHSLLISATWPTKEEVENLVHY
jgi:valyl-tRNA synthetase